MTLDLTKGVCKTEQYEAWKFPGGEIHLKLSKELIYDCDSIRILTRLNSSEDILFLLLVVDTLKKDTKNKITLFIPYMPYQQADQNFGVGECFSLKTVCNLINSMGFDTVYVYHPHSTVAPGLINNCVVIDNSQFIREVLRDLFDYNYISEQITNNIDNLIIISPDAGAYKLIYKLSEKLRLDKCEIITCSKSRNHETGVITTVVPKFDENKVVLIIDDIALGSRTFLNIRKEIPNKDVFLAVSHGVFNENVDILESEFKKIYTTNSRRHDSISEKIKVINIF